MNNFSKNAFSEFEEKYPQLIEFSCLRLKKEETIGLLKKHNFFQAVPNTIILDWLECESNPKSMLLELVAGGFDIDKQKREPLASYKPNSISPYYLRDIGLNPFIPQARQQDLKNFTTNNNLEDLHPKSTSSFLTAHVKHNIDLFGVEPTLLCAANKNTLGKSKEIVELFLELNANAEKIYSYGGNLSGSTFAYFDGAGPFYYGYESILSLALQDYSAYDSDEIKQKKRELISKLIVGGAKVEPSVFYHRHPLALAIELNDSVLLKSIIGACRIKDDDVKFENWNNKAVDYITYAANNAEDNMIEILYEHEYFKNLDICLEKTESLQMVYKICTI